MEENDKNPVLDRLIEFINSTGLSSTQFADTAGIPRPSLSQMLHGRNKSVNNQVLAKLNAAFPNLNILWLLFGQGDMLLNQNIEISQPQNAPENGLFDLQPPVDEFTESIKDSFAEDSFYIKDSSQGSSMPEYNSLQGSKDYIPADSPALSSSAADSQKKISSIIVLYTDGSFQTFKPA